MYGWAWLLKLQMELDTWDDEKGKALAENLQPLADLIIDRYIEFLPKLKYPIRVGTHTNSAFGMSFAYDYAKHAKNDSLILVIEDTANRLYLRDKKCPIGWEPSGYDFLSPCLAEVELMNKILPRDAFSYWINDFMPDLKSNRFSMQVAEVSDREDGAKRLCLRDEKWRRGWDPRGYDCLSRCLAAVECINKILRRDAFSYWINEFMPALRSHRVSRPVAAVSDREHGHLVHLDGLN